MGSVGISLFEGQYPRPSWRVRSAVLIVVALLHAPLLIVAIAPQAPLDAPPGVYLIDFPEEPPQSESTTPNESMLLPPAPRPLSVEVSAPELTIEATEILAPIDLTSAAAVPSATDASDGNRSSSGKAGEGDSGAGTGTGSGASIFTNCKNRVMPIYPSDAKHDNETRRVVLLVQLDERGVIDIVEVAQSSGRRSMDAAAIATVKRWKCTPVYERGRPVRVIAKQEFEFKLR